MSGPIDCDCRSKLSVAIVWRHAPVQGRINGLARYDRGPEGALAIQQAARDVVEVVLGHIQRRLDAKELLSPAVSGGCEWQTMQSSEPVSYVRLDERLVELIADNGTAATHVVTDVGRRISVERRSRARARATFGGVSDEIYRSATSSATRREPAIINVRPGRGGAHRRTDAKHDPTEGLDEIGEVKWWSVPGPGAMLGVITLNPNGNAVLMCRLSGDDSGETLLDQVQKGMALEAQYPEVLAIRHVLLALDMSGTREVRPPRSLPPGPGVLERDDILLLEEWFREGWVEHVIWRDPRRIARDVLPAELIVASLRANRASMWLTSYGRRVDWNSDRLGVRASNMVSAEDRDHTVKALQDARLRKGPSAGKGWRNSQPRFGFVRTPRTLDFSEDTEQWPWIHRAFELADVGDFTDRAGFSTRKLTTRLAEEGCPFDHDRVRKILQDPIYATGEYYVHVRGLPVAQHPIPLTNPVPLDRYLRVQTKFRLRQGSTVRTPLGEFLFNYVDVVHKQCAGERNKRDCPILIKGTVAKDREHNRILRHSPSVPETCKRHGRGYRGAFTWDRAEPRSSREGASWSRRASRDTGTGSDRCATPDSRHCRSAYRGTAN